LARRASFHRPLTLSEIMNNSPDPRPARLLTRVRQSLLSIVVLMVLAGLAWWGHETGWTLPKLVTLTSNPLEKNDDWCEEHGVPESACVECNPELLPRPPAYGWCPEHGVQDCPLEHPDVAQLPSLAKVAVDKLKEQAKRSLVFAEREANGQECKLHPRRIQVASQEALQKMGIQVVQVQELPVEESLVAAGEIRYDPDRVTSLGCPVAGRIWRIESKGNVGQFVKPSDVLALVDAAEVGKAKAEFLQAVGQYELKAQILERLRKGFTEGVVSESRYRDAEAALFEARVRLVGARQTLVNLGLPVAVEEVKGLAPEEIGRRMQFLGLPETLISNLDSHTTTANLIPVRAPFAGVVITRRAALGAITDPSKTLFVVADPRRLWLTLNVPQDSLKRFRQADPQRLLAGKVVHFVPDGTREEVVGTITWVSTAVDEMTRTLQVRAELPNPAGQLRANTFGTGRIILRHEDKAVVVPGEAIQWDGKCHIVFVLDKRSRDKGAPTVFHVRTVRLGARNGPHIEIIAGLLPGEMIATTNSGLLRQELFKDHAGESGSQ
jgi:cobalt-zinc-cadmium efflux system membrane fusion protein